MCLIKCRIQTERKSADEVSDRLFQDEASPDDGEIRGTSDFEKDNDKGYWEIRCASCDHDIEFGWSHPGRTGRIWPAESSDFNPWKSCPDPRFVESWEKKGWLRPHNKP